MVTVKVPGTHTYNNLKEGPGVALIPALVLVSAPENDIMRQTVSTYNETSTVLVSYGFSQRVHWHIRISAFGSVTSSGLMRGSNGQ